MANNLQDQRKAIVRLEILRAVHKSSGYLLPENIAHRDINLHMMPAVLLSEFRGELVDLEGMGLIVIVPGGLGGARKIKLTDAGRAQVAANL
jgi:hypothetical protein